MMLLPKKVGPFTLMRKLDADGAADAYVGRRNDPTGEQIVARKIPPPIVRDAARMGAVRARVADLQTVRHPALVKVHDLVDADGDVWVVEDYIDGVSVGDIVSHGARSGATLPHNVFLNIATQVCNGLEALHGRSGETSGAKHVLHLALTPSAILVTLEGRVMLCGFGLVHVLTKSGANAAATMGGQMEYLCPEQTHPDRTLTPACDVFSLGTILYELLTLRAMFRAESNLQTIHKVRRAEVTTQLLEVKEILPGLDKVLFRALSLNPRHRYQRAFVLREDLRGLMANFSFADIDVVTHEFLAPVWRATRGKGANAALSSPPPDSDADGPTAGGVRRHFDLLGHIDEGVFDLVPETASEAPEATDRLGPATTGSTMTWQSTEDADDEPTARPRQAIQLEHHEISIGDDVSMDAPVTTERSERYVHPGGTGGPAYTSPLQEPTPMGMDVGFIAEEEDVGDSNTASYLRGQLHDPRVGLDDSIPLSSVADDPQTIPTAPSTQSVQQLQLDPDTRELEATQPPPTTMDIVAAAAAAMKQTPRAVHARTRPPTLADSAPLEPARIEAQPIPPPVAPEPPTAPPDTHTTFEPAHEASLDLPPNLQLPPPALQPEPQGRMQSAPPPARVEPPPYSLPIDDEAELENPAWYPFAAGALFLVAALSMVTCLGIGGLSWMSGGPGVASVDPLEQPEPAPIVVAVSPDPEPVVEPQPQPQPQPQPAAPPRPAPRIAAAPTPQPSLVVRPMPAPRPVARPAAAVALVAPRPAPLTGARPTAAQVSDDELSRWSASAFTGNLAPGAAERLTRVALDDPAFTRARTLLYLDAKAKGNNTVRREHLDLMMALPENGYNPVLLVERAQDAAALDDWESALDHARVAGQHWARMPSALIFSRRALIYEIEAVSHTGLFYASEGDDLDHLTQAIRSWERYREHVATQDEGKLLARAEKQLDRLYEVQRRVE